MNLDIILKLLYSNKLENVVIRAIQLESNIPFKYSVDEEVIVEITNSEIKRAGMQFVRNKLGSYGYLKCPIVGIDKYDLDQPYLVKLPDGSVKRFSEDRINYVSSTTEVEAITPDIEVVRHPTDFK